MYSRIIKRLVDERLLNPLIHHLNHTKQQEGLKPLSYSLDLKAQNRYPHRVPRNPNHSLQSHTISYDRPPNTQHKKPKLKPLTTKPQRLTHKKATEVTQTLEPRKIMDANVDLTRLYLKLSRIKTEDAIDLEERMYPNTVQYVKITKQQVFSYLALKFSPRVSQKVVRLLKFPPVINYTQFVRIISNFRNLDIVQSLKFVFHIFDINDNLQVTTKELLNLLEESQFNDYVDKDVKFIIHRCRSKFDDQKNELPAPKLKVLNLRDSYGLTEPSQSMRVKKDTMYTKIFTSEEEDQETDQDVRVKVITNQTFFLGIDEFVSIWYPYTPRMYSEIVDYLN